MRSVILLLSLFVLTAVCTPVSAELVPVSGSVDFGLFKESDGNKTVRTYLRNEGTKPEAILRVRPTCGCTAADFSRDTVMPGDSAWVDLTYNPYRRPGKFEKWVKIYPLEGEMIRVGIKGTVIASNETVDNLYPSRGGLLRLSESTLMPVRSLDTGEKTLYVDLYNTNDFPVWLDTGCDSEAVEHEIFVNPVPPGEKGIIGVYLKPSKESRTGDLEYKLMLYTSRDEESVSASEPSVIRIITQKNSD